MPQPNSQSIAQLLNQSLQPLGITTKIKIQPDCLYILLESDKVPDRQELVPLVSEEIISQGIESIPKMVIYGRMKGTKVGQWSEEVDLSAAQPPDEDEYPAQPPDEDEYQEVSEETEDGEPLDDDEPTDMEEDLSEEEILEEEEEDPKQKSLDKIKKLLSIAAIALVVLLLGVGVWWLLFGKPAPQPTATPTPQPSPVPAVPETPKPANQTSSPTGGVDPAQGWRLAINKATSAAELTQTAQTKADWETVASQWTEAIELLKIVPSDHPEYDRAQQKIVEYQRNLEYAQRVAASRP